MRIETWLKATLLALIVWASIVTFAKADVYLLASYVPIGNTSWEWRGGQDWVYSKTNIMVGVGWVERFNDELKLSTRQYLVVDGKVGATGITGNFTVSLGEVLKVSYGYNYRWYDGSDGDYGYATGKGLIQKVKLDIEVPIF